MDGPGFIRLALPKGRLFDGVQRAFAAADVTFVRSLSRSLHPMSSDPAIAATLYKPRAIPQLVAYGFADLGCTGRDCLADAGYDDVVELFDFGTNRVAIVAAVASGQERLLTDPPKRPLVIASEYEGIARRWAADRGLAHIFLATGGSTEAYAPGIADIVIDCVETGATMEANGLTIVDRILESSTVLVAHRAVREDPQRYAIVSRLVAALTNHATAPHACGAPQE